MAGAEYMLVNPRRKRNRRKKATHPRRPRRRARARVVTTINRRRRRSNPRQRHNARRHHYRHNPTILGGVNWKEAAFVGLGVVGTEIGVGFANKYLPANLQTGPARLLVKAGVGVIAIPLALKLVKQGNLARSFALGAAVAVIVDALHEYVTPKLGLGEYTDVNEQMLSEYRQLQGADDSEMLDPQEVGASENMYADTMYGTG